MSAPVQPASWHKWANWLAALLHYVFSHSYGSASTTFGVAFAYRIKQGSQSLRQVRLRQVNVAPQFIQQAFQRALQVAARVNVVNGLETAVQFAVFEIQRNPLLNYRALKARGMEIVNEKPVKVFRILVREGKAMSFLPTKESGENGLFDQPEELPEEGRLAQYTDLHLQTPYDSVRLQSRLVTTYQAARTFIEEQGVNTLFLALGMLQWYEAESSQEKRRAPSRPDRVGRCLSKSKQQRLGHCLEMPRACLISIYTSLALPRSVRSVMFIAVGCTMLPRSVRSVMFMWDAL